MPEPRPDESRESYMKRCVPQVKKEGKKQDQALAICFSYWRKRKKK